MSNQTFITVTPVTRKSFSLEFKHYAVRYIETALANKTATITVASEERVVDGVAKEPTRKLVAEWTIGTYKNIIEEIGQN